MAGIYSSIRFIDFHPSKDDFEKDAVAGLTQDPKKLQAKYLYDTRGSALFERIVDTREYYPGRIESRILEENANEISSLLGEDCALFEFGSGASRKTRILLKSLKGAASYVPIDISREFLFQSSTSLSQEFPSLEIISVCADYTAPLYFPQTLWNGSRSRAAFFPGSTIGNFEPWEAARFLRNAANILGTGGRLVVGFDLRKDSPVLEAAYNDSEGVTAEFNLNLLLRMNRELGADFNLDLFEHQAFYNARESRVEMHLVSKVGQCRRVAGQQISFIEGETIHTESSYKYSIESFAEIASRAGYTQLKTWTDPENMFAVAVVEASKEATGEAAESQSEPVRELAIDRVA